MQKPEIQSIDHIVMQVANLVATIKFYIEILGMDHSSFQPPTGGLVRQSLHFGLQKINLNDAASPFIPHAKNPVAGSVNLCFITTQPLANWQAHLADHGIDIEDGPVPKTGANGSLLSVYIRDPDHNLIEISNHI
jgi:catechol 2,3-dioxygenase-like lactoylglutathione lyase family enzyme